MDKFKSLIGRYSHLFRVFAASLLITLMVVAMASLFIATMLVLEYIVAFTLAVVIPFVIVNWLWLLSSVFIVCIVYFDFDEV